MNPLAKNKRHLEGTIVSDKMDKTVVVRVSSSRRHRLYGKAVRSHSKYLAHDETNEGRIGDVVRIEESRPLSKLKHWRLMEIVRKAEIAPEEEAAPDDSATV